MPRVTLSKSISRAALGAWTGAWLTRCRPGRISGRFTSLSFRVSRSLPTAPRAPGPDPDRGRASEVALEGGDPSGVVAVAIRRLPELGMVRKARPGRRIVPWQPASMMASGKNWGAERGVVGVSRTAPRRPGGAPARRRIGCRSPSSSRPGGSTPSPRPASGRWRAPDPEPEKAYSPDFWRRRNGSNRVAMDWGGMPRPVSRTENSNRRAPVCRAMTSTDPSAVNLRALVVRLSSTRLSATGCPIRKSASGGVSRTAKLFSSAIGCTMSRTDSRMSVTLNGIGSRSTRRSPPRANSMTSLATELSPNAAL